MPFRLQAAVTAVDARDTPVVYTLRVCADGVSTSITKRFSEFCALRDALAKGHDNVPMLPSKFHLGDPKGRAFLVERKDGLARFVIACMAHPTIPSSPEFTAFLVPALASLWDLAVQARVKEADAAVAELVREVDDANQECDRVTRALAFKLKHDALKRSIAGTFAAWRDETPVKHPAPSVVDMPAAKPGSLRSGPIASSAGPLARALPPNTQRPALMHRHQSCAAVIVREQQKKKGHQHVALQHTLGLAPSSKDMRSVRTLSEASNLIAPSKKRSDTEDMSVSGYNLSSAASVY